MFDRVFGRMKKHKHTDEPSTQTISLALSKQWTEFNKFYIAVGSGFDYSILDLF